MNKYQETMSHIKVDDEMKKRVLQNVQENLDKEKALSDRSEKIIYFKRLGTMAAMFAAAIIGVTAVVKFTGGINSNSPSFDAAPSFEMEATDSVADEEAEEAVAEEATEGAVAEEAAEGAVAEEAMEGDAAAEATEGAVAEEAAESVDSMGRSDANDSLEMEDSLSGNALTENANRTENYAKDYAAGESVTNAEPASEEAAQEMNEEILEEEMSGETTEEAMNAESEAEEATQEIAEPEITEEAAQEISEPEEVSKESSSNIKVIVIAIIILLIATILGLIYWRKKKNQL